MVLPLRGLMNQTTGTKQGSLSRSTRLGCPDHHRMAINRQHRRRGQSGPSHVGLAQSVGLSRCRHSRYGFVLAERHVASTFLRPFARRALPRFVALMDALTPGRSALRILIRDNERRPCARPGILASCTKPSDRSASNHLSPPPRFGLVFSWS